MTKIAGMMLLLIGVSGLVVAGGAPAPEIDPRSAAGALVLLSGALLILRARRNR